MCSKNSKRSYEVILRVSRGKCELSHTTPNNFDYFQVIKQFTDITGLGIKRKLYAHRYRWVKHKKCLIKTSN